MPERIVGKRLLIVEEALKDFVGHWYEYVKSVAELAANDGAEVRIVGHARVSDDLQRELGVIPAIPKSPWDGDYREPFAPWRKLGILRHTRLTFMRVREVLRGEGPFDRTFVPTVYEFQIWAWRLLLGFYRPRIGSLVLLVRNSAATYLPGSAEPVFGFRARLFAWGIRSFTGHVAAGRVVFATDSDKLAEEYRRLTGVSFQVLQSPRVAVPSAPGKARRRTGPMVFACLGPARIEKGIDVLQHAIALYLADGKRPPARFVIQWPAPIRDIGGSPYGPDPALAASGKVDFLTEPLDSTGYHALLASTDCMVLPYRRQAYYARISGVAVEAVTGGIPVITTEDTWTADLMATSGAGLAVADGDAAAVAEAMATVARDRAGYRKAAEARRASAAALHSGEAFLRKLWGEAYAPWPT